MDNSVLFYKGSVKIHSFTFVKHSVTLMMCGVGKAMSKLLIPSAEQCGRYTVNKAQGHTSNSAEKMK